MTKSPWKPPIFPAIGLRVRKKGGPSVGTVLRWQKDWIVVDWDEGIMPKVRPMICHLYELEAVE